MSEEQDTDLVTAELSGVVLMQGSGAVTARIRLDYDCADPYAVVMSVQLPNGQPIPWTFARGLLDAGLQRPSGIGDVKVAPCAQAPTTILQLTLGNGRRIAVLKLRLVLVREFLTSTFRLVPPGREGQFQLVEDDVRAIAG